jgi:TolB protein
MYYSVAMFLRTLTLLAATAMAVLLAGCGGNQQDASSSQDASNGQQNSEAANINSAGDCARSGDALVERSLDALRRAWSEFGDDEDAQGGEVSNGKIAFSRTTEGAAAHDDIYVIDEEGTQETRLTHSAWYEYLPVWSPDGQKIAFIGFSSEPSGDIIPSGDIYVMNADGTNQTRIIHGARYEDRPAWSPDGQKIAFTRSQSGIYVINADGTNEAHAPIFFSHTVDSWRTEVGSPAWSPEGNTIAFPIYALTNDDASASAVASEPSTGERLSGIYLVNVDGTGLCRLTSNYAGAQQTPVWSPNGEKIAFEDKDASYDEGLYVINTDGTGRKKVSGDIKHPYQPVWSPDGKRIAFTDLLTSELYVINANGSGLRRLTDSASHVHLPTWSPDSEKIAFSCTLPAPENSITDPTTYYDLCVINADGTGRKRRITFKATQAYFIGSSWSRE